MKLVKLFSLLLFVLFFLASAFNVQADNTREYANHIVYINAFPTDSLPPQMTKQYGLKRSKNYAMINVSIMEKGAGVPTGVPSRVKGTMKNLMGQSQELEFREIKEGKAVYYIAQVGVQTREVLNFFLDIRPHGADESYEIKFHKKF